MNQVRTSTPNEPIEALHLANAVGEPTQRQMFNRLPAGWLAVLGLAVAYTFAHRALEGEPIPTLVQSPNFDINVNSAEPSEISALPRVGKGLASSVVEHRKAIGGFDNIQQLTDVPRIGEKTISRLADYLTTESK